jgi:ubiquitin carboxyl-terminal hydrolase 34
VRIVRRQIRRRREAVSLPTNCKWIAANRTRTCLKSAPDNLIFHLKRFDFDFSDFTRKKVNDPFAFPHSIDIGRYNVEHLSNPAEPHTEDWFDVVGVVVHFGNCENGHYYSYIRKRPTPSGDVWLNFNDEQVDPFDPAEIAQKTFGGFVENTYNRQYKMYSAYMLFYQRRSAIESDQQRWTTSSQVQPMKVDVPQSIKKEIDFNNNAFIREYCLFDPNHSAFVRHLHGASRRINNGSCSEGHQHETLALEAFLAHLGRVVWRHQTKEIFEDALFHLRRSVLSCKTCCSIALRRLAEDDEILHNLILRASHPSIKSQTRSFLVDCLAFLRDKNAHLYETVTDNDSSSETEADNSMIVPIAKRLRTLAEESSKNTKAWDDLYLLLKQMAEMGHVETSALLDAGILKFCLRLFCMHVRPSIAEKYADFHQRVFQKKYGIYNMMISFMSTVLSRMDLNLPDCDSLSRLEEIDRETMALPFTDEERMLLLSWSSGTKAFAVIDKMIDLFDQKKTESFCPGDAVKWMMKSHDSRTQAQILAMVVQGTAELYQPYCDPYLRMAFSYCEATTSSEGFSKVFNAVVQALAAVDVESNEKTAHSGGAALRFFRRLLRLQNQHISSTEAQSALIKGCQEYAIALLLCPDGDVRIESQDFIQALFMKYMEDPQHLDEAYKCVRATSTVVIKKVVYEMNSTMPHRCLQSLLETGRFLVSLLAELVRSEPPELADLKDEETDLGLVQEWQNEVEARVAEMPDVGLQSPGEAMFDGSDYASDSDEVELLDR